MFRQLSEVRKAGGPGTAICYPDPGALFCACEIGGGLARKTGQDGQAVSVSRQTLGNLRSSVSHTDSLGLSDKETSYQCDSVRLPLATACCGVHGAAFFVCGGIRAPAVTSVTGREARLFRVFGRWNKAGAATNMRAAWKAFSTIPGTGFVASSFVLVFAFGCLVNAAVGQLATDWQVEVRQKVESHQLDVALELVQVRLSRAPDDLEAQGWRARILAWQGHWQDAEADYRCVLGRVPGDVDMLTGLADVLMWQGRTKEALAIIEQARNLRPTEPEILSRRAHILHAVGEPSLARRQYREILPLDPQNAEARRELAGLSEETHHELRIGTDIDTFNYADAAQAQSVLLTSRWTPRWSTAIGADFYQRFGQNAGKFQASGSWRFTEHDWLTAGGAAGHDNAVIPKREASFEYGHGLKIVNRMIKGLEVSYRQRWLWYQGAHVLTVGATQLYYLPKGWMWALTVTGARSGFSNAGIEWVPSGSTRLMVPLAARWSGNLTFAVGTENFAQAEQIGRFSARSYGGGLKYRISHKQDIAGYVAVQDRTHGRTENSYGLSYGCRF